jgi:hypothetical protein
MMKLLIKHQLLFQSTSVFVFFIYFSGTPKSFATLEINIKDCKSNTFQYLHELSLFKDNKRIRLLKPEYDYIQKVTKLKKGTYYLEYNSLFKKTERYKVIITEFKKYSVDLCIDYMNYSKETYKPIIDQLKDNGRYKIIISSQGCFHSTNDTLIIFRKKNSYFVKWSNKKKVLSHSDIEEIRHFELELNYMTNGFCTTTDTYLIVYKNKRKKIVDGSCYWNGNYFLMKKLWNKQY